MSEPITLDQPVWMRVSGGGTGTFLDVLAPTIEFVLHPDGHVTWQKIIGSSEEPPIVPTWALNRAADG